MRHLTSHRIWIYECVVGEDVTEARPEPRSLFNRFSFDTLCDHDRFIACGWHTRLNSAIPVVLRVNTIAVRFAAKSFALFNCYELHCRNTAVVFVDPAAINM